jgi:hypothetical protein
MPKKPERQDCNPLHGTASAADLAWTLSRRQDLLPGSRVQIQNALQLDGTTVKKMVAQFLLEDRQHASFNRMN